MVAAEAQKEIAVKIKTRLADHMRHRHFHGHMTKIFALSCEFKYCIRVLDTPVRSPTYENKNYLRQ